MATVVQGANLLHEFSADGITYTPLVCAQGGKVDQKANITTEKTKCGTFKGVDDPDWSMSGDAVANILPGSGEISLNQVNEWLRNKTLVYVRVQSPAHDAALIGDDYYRGGQGYFGSTSDDISNGAVVKFSWTFEGIGQIDIYKPLAIITQPVTPINIAIGATLTITVTTTGGASPKTYQWKKNGTNIGGATSATYSKPSAGTGDSGTYTVVITDADAHTVTSANSVVTVS